MSSLQRVTWGVNPGDRCEGDASTLGPASRGLGPDRSGAVFHAHAEAAERTAKRRTGNPANNEGWANDSPLEAALTSRGPWIPYVAGGGEEITRDGVQRLRTSPLALTGPEE